MSIREIHLAHADFGADPYEAGSSPQASLRHRAEVVDLEFDCGETTGSGKMAVERQAYSRVGDTGGHTAVHRAGAVEEIGPQTALDGDAVAVQTNQFESEQSIEGMSCQEIRCLSGSVLRVIQVW